MSFFLRPGLVEDLLKDNNLNENSPTDLIWRFFAVALIYFSLYLLNNRYQYFSPLSIPRTQIDEIIPFTPWGVYFYLFAYIQPTLVFIYLFQEKDFRNMLFLQNHILIVSLIANVIFFFLPTTIDVPYSSYSINDFLNITDTITAYCLTLIYSVDKPFNCLPSLHVAISFIATYVLWTKQRLIVFTSVFLSLLIALSTLLTKQHIYYDVIFGFLLSIVTIPLVQKTITKSNT